MQPCIADHVIPMCQNQENVGSWFIIYPKEFDVHKISRILFFKPRNGLYFNWRHAVILNQLMNLCLLYNASTLGFITYGHTPIISLWGYVLIRNLMNTTNLWYLKAVTAFLSRFLLSAIESNFTNMYQYVFHKFSLWRNTSSPKWIYLMLFAPSFDD